MKKAEKVNQLHEEAMRLAEEAFFAKRAKDMDSAQSLYKQAFQLEQEAALMMIGDYDIEPTRSVLFKGAATLALDSGQYVEAERMIRFGLAGHPPSLVAKELRTLLAEVHAHHSPMNKFEQLPEELQREVSDFIDFLLIKHQSSVPQAI
ncbi:MAG: DUF2281 domain-containing protein [Bacteroidota bacterium]